MRKPLVLLAVLVMCATGALAAHSAQSGADAYEWSGEFVSLDETIGTVTIKARLWFFPSSLVMPPVKVSRRHIGQTPVHSAEPGAADSAVER